MEGAAAAHGYRLAVDGQEYFGHRAEPLLYIEGEQGSLGVAVPRFWQNCPKRISVDRERLEIELFPEIEGNLYELQGGEQKTHTIWFDFAPHTSGDAYARLSEANRTTPWIASCDSYEGAGIIPSCSTAQDSDRRRLDDYLDEAVARLLANRERVDEYGWRNYGDIYADHEEEHYKGRQPLVSHYNNQFDMLLGFLWQYLLTGAERWWELAEPLGRHVMDIDVYRTSRDRAAYSGGMFWFTDHFLHAHTSTHRTYSRHNADEKPWQYGGGPGAEHNFTSGLALLYRLTGDPDARDTVRLLADWVIGMDDGRRNILGVIDDGPTGLATRTGHSLYHGPGRGAGNSINALLDAYAVTEKSDYLQYAERLIRRCIHPSDDIDSLQFLEPEKRWSYTMFLAALLKYLQVKRDGGQLDGAYAYAQASLLHYARWMLAHERPYFDQVEKLQYPNETWAAQEFRKANVMRLASAHAEPRLAEQLMARGTELADRAWSDLLNFKNRASARAMAIVMVEGQIDLALRGTAPEPMPIVPGEGSYDSPSQFVPQRQRVVARLKNPIAAICTIGCVVNPRRWARYFSAPRVEC